MNEDKKGLFLDALRGGLLPLQAADFAGITLAEVEEWRHDDGDFRRNWLNTEAVLERECIDAIINVGKGKTEWRAAAWYLERRFAARWSGKEMKEEMEDDGDIQIILKRLAGIAASAGKGSTDK
jgi:hypothetical protein